MKRMMKGGVLALGLCLSVGTGLSGAAQAANIADDIKVDSVQSGTIRVGRAYVPLPEGEWTVVSVNETRNSANNVLVEVNLAAFMGRELYGYITIGTNQEISGTGWNTYAFCDRSDIYYVVRDSNQQHDQSCWGINHYVWDKTSTYKPTFGINIQSYLAARGITMPGTTVGTVFHFGNRSDYVNYFVYRNIALAGFKDESGKWADSSWHKDLARNDPAKMEYLEGVKAQGAKMYAAMKDGAIYRAPTGATPTAANPVTPPAIAAGTAATGTAAAGTNGGTAEQRLLKLSDLLKSGLITQAEYDAKRRQILDGL